MGTWSFKALITSAPHSATFHGSSLPSREMQTWHSGLLTRSPQLSQLLLVLSTPQHFWIFPVSAKRLPTASNFFSYFVCLLVSHSPFRIQLQCPFLRETFWEDSRERQCSLLCAPRAQRS